MVHFNDAQLELVERAMALSPKRQSFSTWAARRLVKAAVDEIERAVIP